MSSLAKSTKKSIKKSTGSKAKQIAQNKAELELYTIDLQAVYSAIQEALARLASSADPSR
jgi:hypothetical protein